MKDLYLEEQYKNSLDYYNYLLDNNLVEPGDYIVKILRDLISLSLEVNQLEIPEEIMECKRVVKIKRMLPIEEIRINHPELIVFEGVFVAADGIAIPKSMFKEINLNRPDQSSLPGGFDYGTLKYTNNYAFAFKKSTLTNHINTSKGWEFFDLLSQY